MSNNEYIEREIEVALSTLDTALQMKTREEMMRLVILAQQNLEVCLTMLK